jgi:translation elongation factor EF-1beta
MSEIKEKMKPQDMRAEEIGFGIKLIKAAFRFNDEQTGSSKIEEAVKNIEGVGEVEVEEETLL